MDLINRLRSDVTNLERVSAWSEAVESLADLILPWADEDFRKKWEARRIRHVRVGGRLVPYPSATDCREAQLIIMGLLDRSGLLVKRRNVSGPAPRDFAAEAAA